MKRVALWLLAEVGEGNKFTKEKLRKEFPGVSQIDRRMRDLRKFEWQIDTNREDWTLDPHEHCFVKAGLPVWEQGVAISQRANAAIGASMRREVLAADGNMCRSCGITPGHLYAGTHEMAQLDIARRQVVTPTGVEVQLVTECKRCRVGGRGLEASLERVLRDLSSLGAMERRVLTGWVNVDRRDFSRIEELWSDYRSLPAEARSKVREELGLS
ncbi:hypothetical protein [Amycolatopsis keratiniphila]|uniref:HNH endonuclease n=1 Tax=Amycolatopsis keratiniphila subsp. keratiniphila TaxID=227715 RepID=A0A1W2LRE4_9PSEU|nr:hypothetical protein [Amycolatopsis keratiniphila]ONF66909.1 hypothetical protein AVR91_0223440 [Amycolatopsis keratiniphila subsp. keratiniphila]